MPGDVKNKRLTLAEVLVQVRNGDRVGIRGMTLYRKAMASCAGAPGAALAT